MKFSDKFIKASDELCSLNKNVPAPYIRKSFSLDFVPEKAEITICGLGFYKLYINGRDITKGAMAPYINNTDEICYYDNYDISNLLNEGENAIGIILGNGFRNPFGGFIWDFDTAPHVGALCCALYLEAQNGEKHFELEADESFKAHPSPILSDDIRMGFCYDSRLEIPNWNKADFDDSGWDNAKHERKPRGIARLCDTDPIVVTEKVKPVEFTYYEKLPFAYESTAPDAAPLEETVRENVYVYDFGINASGVTMLKINGRPGQKITVRHGEHLIGGKFSINTTAFLVAGTSKLNEHYQTRGQVDTFICKGGEEVFIPEFKYDGFRYAYVEGLEPEQATEDALTYLVMNSDIESRAGFNCSDDVINKLWECSRRSDISNFNYFPTDCPHREKNGWTGDASVSAEHMLLSLKAERSLKEWLANIREAQNSQGAVPCIVPTGGWGYGWGSGPAWDSVIVNLPYYIYKFSGDKSVIEDNAAMIMRYFFFIASKRDDRGLIEYGLGDWMDPFEEEKGYISAPLIVTDSIIVYNMAVKSELLFKAVGKQKEAEYAHEFAREMRKSIRDSLIDFDTMTVQGDCQTSQALALEMGIFDEAEKAAADKRLIEIIHRDGDVNACGMIGVRYLFHALTNAGESELAYKIITSKERSCYGYWIENGAVTLWESFKDANGEYVDSRNHHFLGDISSWFVQELAGLKPNPDMNDISYFEISPKFINKLSYAEAFYDSEFGRVTSKWERTENGIELSVTVPGGVKGRMLISEEYAFADGTNTKDLQCGTYKIKRIADKNI